MNIDTYIEKLRESLRAAAELGGDEAKQAADRVGAAEISSELPSGSVGVRLEGEGLQFDFHHGAESYPQPPAAPADDEDDSLTARITLRIPEAVKSRVEECATTAGVSLNSWITTVLREASTTPGWSARINLGGIPFVDVQAPWAEPRPGRRSGTRMQGWI